MKRLLVAGLLYGILVAYLVVSAPTGTPAPPAAGTTAPPKGTKPPPPPPKATTPPPKATLPPFTTVAPLMLAGINVEKYMKMPLGQIIGIAAGAIVGIAGLGDIIAMFAFKKGALNKLIQKIKKRRAEYQPLINNGEANADAAAEKPAE